jgi:hypothetical protein
MTTYAGRIRGNYQTIYWPELPLAMLISPPLGWKVHRVSRWRDGCPDACWRLLLKRI